MTVDKMITSSCHLYLANLPGENNLSLSYNNNEPVLPNADPQIINPPMKALLNNRIRVPANSKRVKRPIKVRA